MVILFLYGKTIHAFTSSGTFTVTVDQYQQSSLLLLVEVVVDMMMQVEAVLESCLSPWTDSC